MSEKKPLLFEVCCGSAEDVIEAAKGGAGRVELNSNLFHGGLTPTVGSLITAKRHVDIPIMCMVRPREGGFCYTDVEFEVMLDDAKKMIAAGATRIGTSGGIGIISGNSEHKCTNCGRCKTQCPSGNVTITKNAN